MLSLVCAIGRFHIIKYSEVVCGFHYTPFVLAQSQHSRNFTKTKWRWEEEKFRKYSIYPTYHWSTDQIMVHTLKILLCLYLIFQQRVGVLYICNWYPGTKACFWYLPELSVLSVIVIGCTLSAHTHSHQKSVQSWQLIYLFQIVCLPCFTRKYQTSDQNENTCLV
jgi:hypothetical protein